MVGLRSRSSLGIGSTLSLIWARWCLYGIVPTWAERTQEIGVRRARGRSGPVRRYVVAQAPGWCLGGGDSVVVAVLRPAPLEACCSTAAMDAAT